MAKIQWSFTLQEEKPGCDVITKNDAKWHRNPLSRILLKISIPFFYLVIISCTVLIFFEFGHYCLQSIAVTQRKGIQRYSGGQQARKRSTRRLARSFRKDSDQFLFLYWTPDSITVYGKPVFNSNAFVQICDLLLPKYNPLYSFIILTKHNSSHFVPFTCFVFFKSFVFHYKRKYTST